MSGIVNARHDLADMLEEAGFNVENHVPANITPPLLFIRPVDNPITIPEQGMSGLEFTYRVGLVLVTDANPDGQEAIDSIESMLESVLWNIDGWEVETVERPVVWKPPAGGRFPAIGVVVSTTISLEGGE